jgi:putative addiction module killer protein
MFLIPQKFLYYVTKSGNSPFIQWFESLDHDSEQVVRKRLERVRLGNFGDYKNLAEGVFELRIHFAGGYRIYFGHDGREIIILLCGGDKGDQSADIKRAKLFWEDYKNAKK